MRYSTICTDRFYFDFGGRLLSAGNRVVSLRVVDEGGDIFGLQSVRVIVGSAGLNSKDVFFMNPFGQLRSAFLDTEKPTEELCLVSTGLDQIVPRFRRCEKTALFEAQTAWFFDGGDCRFNQQLAPWLYVTTCFSMFFLHLVLAAHCLFESQ